MTGNCTTNWAALWCRWLKGDLVKCTRPEIARRTWQLGTCRRRCGLVPNTPDGNTADSERIAGPLPEQITRVLTYLRMSPLTSTVSRKDGGGRHDYPSYFDWVLQEAHRECRRPPGLRGIEDLQIIIRLFPDHIEIPEPGSTLQHPDRREFVRGMPACPPLSAPHRLHAGLQERRDRQQLHGSAERGIPEPDAGQQPAPVGTTAGAGEDRECD